MLRELRLRLSGRVGRAGPRLGDPGLSFTPLEELEGRMLLSAAVVEGQLQITGTKEGDVVVISPGALNGHVVVNQAPDVPNNTLFTGVNSILIVTGKGDDSVSAEGGAFKNVSGADIGVNVDAGKGEDSVVGSANNDSLLGSKGNDLLVGGAGNDLLDGHNNNDVLIGAEGDDTLLGGKGMDLLIGGRTSFAPGSADMASVFEQWTAGGSFDARVRDVRYPDTVADNAFLLVGLTIFESSANVVDGGKGKDFDPLGVNDGTVTNTELLVAPFLPDFSAAVFPPVPLIDNTYHPLTVGDQYIYEGQVMEGRDLVTERVVIDVLSSSRTLMVMGVPVTVREVRDTAFIDGVKVEETVDFFAQDIAGNVWYFGEEVVNFVYDKQGNLVGTNNGGSWVAGMNGARPGFQMMAAPVLGMNYYQEFAPFDDALDQAVVHNLNRTVDVTFGPPFTMAHVFREFTDLEPDALENKNYGQNTGLILIEHQPDENDVPEETIELIAFTHAV